MQSKQQTAVEKSEAPGFHSTALHRPNCEETFITVTPAGNEGPVEVFAKAAKALRESGARIVRQKVLSLPGHQARGIEAIRECLGEIDWPVTWLEEEDGNEHPIAGSLIQAVRGPEVTPLRLNGRIVGSLFEDDHARYCILGDLRDDDPSRPRADQALQVLQNMLDALAQTGMDFANVIRTWFFNDDILAWYGEFNEVRTQFFRRHGVFDGLVPASTGIGARNPAGSALVGGLFAVEGKSDSVKTFAVHSPLQSSAMDYGSSFSRASELAMPGHRRLFISGTASIEPNGKTVFVDDIAGQVDLTMRVVGAILESRRMDWSDVLSGLAYVLNHEDEQVYLDYCKTNAIPTMPVLVTNKVVCRHDLLFEVEATAGVIE